MSSFLSSCARTGALVFALASAAHAQVATVNGTGCPAAPAPAATGTPRVGQTLTLTFPPPPVPFLVCTPGIDSVWFIGFDLTPRFNLDPPLGCTAGCTIATTPTVIMTGTSLPLRVPNNPALIGGKFSVQSGCAFVSATFSLCANVSKRVDVTVMP